MAGLVLRESAERVALAHIIASAFEVHRGKLEPPASSLDKALAAVAQELEGAQAVVVVFGEKLIGCIFYEARGNAVHISRLAVLSQHQGKGVARALLGEVEKRARLSVRLALGDTRDFHERLGYKLEGYGRHDGYPEPTFVKLVKDL